VQYSQLRGEVTDEHVVGQLPLPDTGANNGDTSEVPA
jgi:hypothetical protein